MDHRPFGLAHFWTAIWHYWPVCSWDIRSPGSGPWVVAAEAADFVDCRQRRATSLQGRRSVMAQRYTKEEMKKSQTTSQACEAICKTSELCEPYIWDLQILPKQNSKWGKANVVSPLYSETRKSSCDVRSRPSTQHERGIPTWKETTQRRGHCRIPATGYDLGKSTTSHTCKKAASCPYITSKLIEEESEAEQTEDLVDDPPLPEAQGKTWQQEEAFVPEVAVEEMKERATNMQPVVVLEKLTEEVNGRASNMQPVVVKERMDEPIKITSRTRQSPEYSQDYNFNSNKTCIASQCQTFRVG